MVFGRCEAAQYHSDVQSRGEPADEYKLSLCISCPILHVSQYSSSGVGVPRRDLAAARRWLRQAKQLGSFPAGDQVCIQYALILKDISF
jgi:hypothetical protein